MSQLENVNGIMRANGYWNDSHTKYLCDCDECMGNECKCKHKFFLSNIQVDENNRGDAE